MGIGTAAPFAILGEAGVTNTGPSLIYGDLAGSTGTPAVTGFTFSTSPGPGEVEAPNTMPMKNPPHPGNFIRTEIVGAAGLSVTAAAAALHVSRPALSSLLNGNSDLSGDMALRIEKAFGVKMDTLMRMQSSYDIAQTRKREKQIHIRRIQQLADILA
jgi:addiction module HigA family antidote